MITFTEICEAYLVWTAPIRRSIRHRLHVGRHMARHIFYLPHVAVAAVGVGTTTGLVCHQVMNWIAGPDDLPPMPPDVIIFTPLPDLTGPVNGVEAVPVPEPSTAWVLAVGIVVILGIVRRRA